MSKKVLIVSPQASRLGHGAFHGQRTLAAFSEYNNWETIFLTGDGFLDLNKSALLYGDIIEAPVNISTIGSYSGNISAFIWGIKRLLLFNKYYKYVDELLKSIQVDVVLLLDGDVYTRYRCWLRNKRVYPNVGWVIAHSTIDFWITAYSVRSFYKKWLASQVRHMTEEMGATILYVAPKMAQEYCRRLNISSEAAKRIVLTDFGSDAEDMRLSISEARNNLGIPLDVKVALFFGLIRPDKRPDIAIRAISEMPSEWWLLIAGKPHGIDRDYLMNLIHSCEIINRSRLMLYYLDEQEVQMVYSAADVLLMPHDRSVVSNSGVFSMARSYRLPVIVSDVGSLGDTVRFDEIGFVAIPGEVTSFVDKLSEFSALSNSEIKAMKDRIEMVAHNKSFHSTVGDYIHAFEIAVNYSISSQTK